MFLGKSFTRAQRVVPGTVVQESRQRKRRVRTVPTLSGEVLGQCSLGTGSIETSVLGQCSLGTGSLGTVQSWDRQSWDSGLGTGSLGTGSLGTAVLGQCSLRTGSLRTGSLGTGSLGTGSLGTAVLGQAVLGQWSWDNSLGTLREVLGQHQRVLGQYI